MGGIEPQENKGNPILREEHTRIEVPSMAWFRYGPEVAPWEVVVEGEATDLEALVALSNKVGSPEFEVIQRGPRYFFRHHGFKHLTNAEAVNQVAILYLEALSGLAMLQYGKYKFLSVRVGETVVGKQEDGSIKYWASGGSSFLVRDRPAGVETGPQGPTLSTDLLPGVLEGWEAISNSDRTVAEALYFYSLIEEDHRWRNLDKVREIIELDVGRTGITVVYRWVSKIELSRFTGTANSWSILRDKARHANMKHPPPKKKITLEEAEEIISRLLLGWLQTKK